jgi:hypothetical protein
VIATKNEKQGIILDYISRLALGLPLADFYREVFPTDEMKTIVASMYVEVVEFLDRATSYYCLGSLSESLPSSALDRMRL